MAFCNNCGNNLSNTDQACPECGNASLSKTGETVGRNIDRVIRYAENSIPEVKSQFRSGNYRLISPAMFLLALLCLFMPFVSFSCGGQEITVTGLELATGKSAFGERIQGSGWAVFLILVLLSGLGLSFWKDQRNTLYSIVAASVASITLLGIAAGISNEMTNQDMMGLASYELRSGFYFMFLSMLAAGAVNVLFFRQSKQSEDNEPQKEHKDYRHEDSSSLDRSKKDYNFEQGAGITTTDEGGLFIEDDGREEELQQDRTIEWRGGIYKGQLKNNIPDGLGKIQMPNSVFYEGVWKDGKPHNHGKMTYSSGAKYVGCFSEGKRHGFGIYVKQDGTKVLGEWEKGDYLKGNRRGFYKYLYYIIYEELYSIPALAAKLNINEDEVFSNVEKIIAAGWLPDAEIDTDKKQIIVLGLNHRNDEPTNNHINSMDTASIKNDAVEQPVKKSVCISCQNPLKRGAKYCSMCGQFQQ